ncbi:hypothetical protein [Nonomuraea sp. NPDC048901]|uniref:hypothetical protein n=1 Tax=Nonomuraea sp. NPDC048901 TaxID=3155627 RepID=UPI0033F0147A
MVFVAGIVWVLGPGARWVLEHMDGVAIGGPAGLGGKDLAAALDAVRGRVLAVATGLAALVAVYYTARNADTARRTFRLGERGHVTDRYGKAVEQLGSAQAPIRLGGLHALEQLAQDNPAPEFRQTIVDVICAYLRMPYTPPRTRPAGPRSAGPRSADGGVSAPAGRDPHEERQVRLTAQRILTAHLRYQDPPARRWRQPHSADLAAVGGEGSQRVGGWLQGVGHARHLLNKRCSEVVEPPGLLKEFLKGIRGSGAAASRSSKNDR